MTHRKLVRRERRTRKGNVQLKVHFGENKGAVRGTVIKGAKRGKQGCGARYGKRINFTVFSTP